MTFPGDRRVASFGQREQMLRDAEGGPIVVFPPIRLESVQLPIELVIDEDSLAAFGARIRETVAAAVLDGFEEATGIRVDEPVPEVDGG